MNVYCDHCENVKKSIGKPKKTKKTKALIKTNAKNHWKTQKNQKNQNFPQTADDTMLFFSLAHILQKFWFFGFFLGFPMVFGTLSEMRRVQES